MIRDKLMKLIDDYVCEVADTPSSPTPNERKLATERIERARNAVVTELAKPAPTQPAWHDAPNAPGLWVSIDKHNQYDWHLFRDPMTYPLDQSWVDKSRYFGPIPLPEDRK